MGTPARTIACDSRTATQLDDVAVGLRLPRDTIPRWIGLWAGASMTPPNALGADVVVGST